LDVTGTLLQYCGHIGDIYGVAPAKYGYPEIPNSMVHTVRTREEENVVVGVLVVFMMVVKLGVEL